MEDEVDRIEAKWQSDVVPDEAKATMVARVGNMSKLARNEIVNAYNVDPLGQ